MLRYFLLSFFVAQSIKQRAKIRFGMLIVELRDFPQAKKVWSHVSHPKQLPPIAYLSSVEHRSSPYNWGHFGTHLFSFCNVGTEPLLISYELVIIIMRINLGST